MIIAIDFDGTIVSDEYPEIGVVKPHAKETINRWKAEGHYIIIWTCRTGHYLEMAKRWLEFMEIEYDSINQSCPENLNMYRIDTRKVFADVYIDDKGLIELPDWRTINELVTKKLA